MKKILSTTLFLSSVPLFGSTIWQAADNALASAAWDNFSAPARDPMSGVVASGATISQGSAQTTSGSLITSSELSTEIIDAYNGFIGGIGSSDDTYYIHDGGFQWTADVTLSGAANYVRVSYALFAGGMGAPSAFRNSPSISGASEVNSGTYSTANGTVFFTDLALTGSPSQLSAQFGDAVFPMFPGSFRSVDSVQIEVFDSLPSPVLIPEPSSLLLSGLAFLTLFRRRR